MGRDRGEWRGREERGEVERGEWRGRGLEESREVEESVATERCG